MARDSTRVYVGDLGSGGSKPELEREFERYGSLKSVWVARNPPGKLYLVLCSSLIRNISVRLCDRLWAGFFCFTYLTNIFSAAILAGYRGSGYSLLCCKLSRIKESTLEKEL